MGHQITKQQFLVSIGLLRWWVEVGKVEESWSGGHDYQSKYLKHGV